jgi:O-acetyl-ADP-ribose deacetylase
VNKLRKETLLPTGQVFQLIEGDLTEERTDAIVNAANSYLDHGGGLAWAISSRGGEAIQRESDEWVRVHGLVKYAEPAWTSGGALPARYVIYAVGPVWGEGDEKNKLGAAVTGSLKAADQLKMGSIALPAISTGIFGYPMDKAAEVILETTIAYFSENDSGLKLVKLVLFDGSTLKIFEKAWNDHFRA